MSAAETNMNHDQSKQLCSVFSHFGAERFQLLCDEEKHSGLVFVRNQDVAKGKVVSLSWSWRMENVRITLQ